MATDRIFKLLMLSGPFQVRGSSLSTLRLANALQDYPIDAVIVTPDARSVAPELRVGLKFAEYPYLLARGWGWVVQKLLLDELRRDPPDLIHIQSRSMLPVGNWLAKKLKVPFLVTVHDYLSPRDRFPFDRQYGRGVICVSESVRTELQSSALARMPDELIHVIPSGVLPASDLNIDMPEVLGEGHVPVIGTAGRLERGKGTEFFLHAAQAVLETRPNVEFLIAGAGPDEIALRQLARDLKISSRVTFIPNLFEFSVAIAAMDIFCLPALQQGLGTIMLEAMSQGKPVIASGVGGVRSILEDNETGLIVEPGDSKKLAERMLELLDDPTRARLLGETGRQHITEEFHLGHMVASTIALYAQVLDIPTPERKPNAEVIPMPSTSEAVSS